MRKKLLALAMACTMMFALVAVSASAAVQGYITGDNVRLRVSDSSASQSKGYVFYGDEYGDWDGLVTIEENGSTVYTWAYIKMYSGANKNVWGWIDSRYGSSM